MKYITKIKFIATLIFLGTLTLSFTTNNFDAKNQGITTLNELEEKSKIFIEIKGLDPYTYGDLVKAVRLRDDLTIKSACVPANMIMFETTENNTEDLENNFEAIKGLVIQTTSLLEVNLMVGYSEEVFLTRCQEFRRGR